MARDETIEEAVELRMLGIASAAALLVACGVYANGLSGRTAAAARNGRLGRRDPGRPGYDGRRRRGPPGGQGDGVSCEAEDLADTTDS